MKIKEWHRTVILLIAIAFATGFIIWLRTGYQASLLDVLN